MFRTGITRFFLSSIWYLDDTENDHLKRKERETRRSNGTISYCDSDRLNKAHYSADITIKALNDTKKMINAAGGYDAVREISLSKIRG